MSCIIHLGPRILPSVSPHRKRHGHAGTIAVLTAPAVKNNCSAIFEYVVITDIYPHELQLKKTTECETQLSYLDVLITIENGKYSTAVYDKRDNFNFNIVNFPYLSSNIPSGPAYGVYTSQLVRIGRICSNYTEFAKRHYKLTQRLIHQGFRYSALCLTFKRFAKKFTQVLDKYGCSIRKHIEDGICLPAMDPFLSRHVSRRSI